MKKTKFLMLFFVFILPHSAFSKNIAVLPFQNLTQNADKNWIGAGFSETLAAKLANAKNIKLKE